MAKILVSNENNLCTHLYPPHHDIEVTDQSVTVRDGDLICYVITEANSTNVTYYEGVNEVPDDWAESKYFYDGSAWSLNNDWSEPEPPGVDVPLEGSTAPEKPT